MAASLQRGGVTSPWKEHMDVSSDLSVWTHSGTGEMRFTNPREVGGMHLVDDDALFLDEWLLEEAAAVVEAEDEVASSEAGGAPTEASAEEAKLDPEVRRSIDAFHKFEGGEGRFSLAQAFGILELVHAQDRRVFAAVEVRPSASPVRDMGAHSYLMSRSGKRGRNGGASNFSRSGVSRRNCKRLILRPCTLTP